MSHKRSRASQAIQVFSVNPMPYPVLVILVVLFIFLGIQWSVSYESMVESAQETMGWLLIATPVVLVFVVKWLSSMDNPESFLGLDQRRRRRTYGGPPSDGSSPWGVAAMIVLVLLLLQYQSSFLESWFV